MRHIQVAAKDDRLPGIQLRNLLPECAVPFHPVVNSGQLRLGIGGIAGNQIKIGVLQSDHTAFRIQLRDPNTIADRKGLFFGKHSSSGIAFFLGIVPELMVTVRLEPDLSGLQLCFLKAEYICIRLMKEVLKAFTDAGPQTVDIP